MQGGGFDHETEDEYRAWRDSERRSRERRLAPPTRPRRRVRVWVLPAVLLALGVALALTLTGASEVRDPRSRAASPAAAPAAEDVRAAPSPARARRSLPSAAAVRRAWRYARSRGGEVSIAVVDTAGRLRGRRAGRRYVSASVVKAMLLVAEVRRLKRDGIALDRSTERVLRAMITYSDNDAADSIYLRVGDAGLFEVARAAGMKRFSVAGYWANAQITAADMARCFSRLPRLLAGPHRRWAMGLFASVIDEQRWGVPRAAGKDWAVFFKGGWRATGRGELVHQVGLLRKGGQRVVIAVLTDAQPSQLYAIHTVYGVAKRLLDPHIENRAVAQTVH